MRASHDRDCTCTMTLWTCEFARKHLTVWAPLDIGTDELIEFTPPATVYFIELPLRNGLGDLDLNATRWDVAANNGTCRSRLSGSSGGLRKTCMCKTACGQQWESAFDSDCSGVQLLSQLTYISLPSSNTHNNSSLQHSKTSTKYLDPDQKPPTLKRGAPSPHICTLGSSSEPHLPLRCGDRISKST